MGINELLDIAGGLSPRYTGISGIRMMWCSSSWPAGTSSGRCSRSSPGHGPGNHAHFGGASDFEVFGVWFAREDFEAWTFINVLLEMGPGTRSGRPASITLPGSADTSGRWRRKLAWPRRRVRPVLAHPDERVHYFGGGRRHRSRRPRPANGCSAHRTPPALRPPFGGGCEGMSTGLEVRRTRHWSSLLCPGREEISAWEGQSWWPGLS